jgi:hypothetical protein
MASRHGILESEFIKIARAVAGAEPMVVLPGINPRKIQASKHREPRQRGAQREYMPRTLQWDNGQKRGDILSSHIQRRILESEFIKN